MSRARWIQVEAGRQETAGAAMVAGALAVGVGLVTFYVTRMFLAREPLAELDPVEPEPGTDVAKGSGEA